jgi:TetR/AcrR family fatty acid metabolism transcriptional regulator
MARSKNKVTPAGEVRHAAKFQRILDAALLVFAKHGFHGAKISDVARAADVADGTVYLYFKNKEDLMACLLDQKLTHLTRDLRHTLAGLSDARKQLLHLVNHHVQLNHTQPQLFALVRQHMHGGDTLWRNEVHAKLEAYLQEWTKIVDAGCTGRVFAPKANSALVVHLLFGALDYACAAWGRRVDADPAALEAIAAHGRQLALHLVNAAP